MSTDVDINAVMNRWRIGVKRKMRGIASFAERAQMRFDAIEQHVYTHRVALDEWQFRPCVYDAWGDYRYTDGDWRTIRVGEQWGGKRASAFFRRRVEIPQALAGRKVVLRIYVGGDSLLFVNGRPYHGLDPFRHEVPLCDAARAGECLDLLIESYVSYHAGDTKVHDFAIAELAGVDEAVRAAYWDLWAVAKMLEIADLDAPLRQFIESNLWEAMKLVPLQEADAARFRQAALDAQRRVRETVYASDRFGVEGLMHLVGHSHLDVVFMWPYKEFLRKIGRTHATMLRLMEQYDEFKFCQSQAKIYADMKRCYPDLFEQVKRRVAEGRWEPIGAFWVEPDCNLVSGESFVRQILHGQRFFRDEFGMTSRTCWQPDVFGLSWALPQILARSGVEYFLTNKMVPWNDTNPWRLNTFWWEGMDGSRVLGIVPPGHFIGTVDPDVIDQQWRNFADRDTIGQTLHVYGWGDGGGGPDPEMIESGRRYAAMPGLVPMKFSSAEEAFDRIAERARQAEIPVLRDEIYLEAHRGSLTNKGRLKKLNRRSELLYREAELLAALAWADGADYPAGALDEGWKELLTAQFHDSLPGTHVGEVYGDLLADYEKITGIGQLVRCDALACLAGPAAPAAQADAVVVFNSQMYRRDDHLLLPADWASGRAVADAAGRVLPQQDVVGLDGSAGRCVRVPPVPSVGFRVLRLVEAKHRPKDTPAVCATDRTLENEHLLAEFDGSGRVVSLLDKRSGRAVLAAGQAANEFQLYEDTPGKYDAWDIVATYKDHPIDISAGGELAVDESGPVRASLRLVRRVGGSRIVQRICLYAGGDELVFETRVEWVERQRLLKVAFPVDVNADHFTCDIAYGSMPRPTRPRNPYERARFEVCAHQWMDLSEAGCGVSILNDCKYGCDAVGNVLRLTLLKGSIHPDPDADRETHEFTYTIYPHAGGWREGGTIARAMNLNAPLLAQPAAAAAVKVADGLSLVSCDAPNLTLEAVKRSEDGEHLVLRLAERHNARTKALLRLARPAARAWACDLMEKPEAELPAGPDGVGLAARPREIVTVRAAPA